MILTHFWDPQLARPAVTRLHGLQILPELSDGYAYLHAYKSRNCRPYCYCILHKFWWGPRQSLFANERMGTMKNIFVKRLYWSWVGKQVMFVRCSSYCTWLLEEYLTGRARFNGEEYALGQIFYSMEENARLLWRDFENLVQGEAFQECLMKMVHCAWLISYSRTRMSSVLSPVIGLHHLGHW